MFIPNGVDEDYLAKKLAHLLFEITEFPGKREILYLAVCYCQLTLWGFLPGKWSPRGVLSDFPGKGLQNGKGTEKITPSAGSSEISLSSLERCLKRYLIDLERYPWRDYLMEYEIFYLRSGNKFVTGREIVVQEETPGDDGGEENPPGGGLFIGIDPRYLHLKGQFCDRVLTYWRHLSHLENLKTPQSGDEVLRNAVKLINLGLYGEAEVYLDDYLPYLLSPPQLLLYRILKLIARVNGFILSGLNRPAVEELDRLEKFLKDFSEELKVWEYDFALIRKRSRKLRKILLKGRAGFPLTLERKGESWKEKLKRFFRRKP